MRGYLLVLAIAAMCSFVYAQEAQQLETPQLKFETAAIAPSDPASQDGGMQGKPHRWTARSQTVFAMMVYAFDAHPSQFSDVPKWAV